MTSQYLTYLMINHRLRELEGLRYLIYFLFGPPISSEASNYVLLAAVLSN